MNEDKSPPFKYDVAISLLDEDLKIAKQIAELLSDRLNVFLYSEKQLELAGTDGIDTFSEVFRRDARIVVLLAREQWGKTKWTRIEETALKSRGLEEGWDYLFVITLEGMRAVPVWVPVAQLWAELDRLGHAGAAAVIERKLQERGVDVRPESAEDLAARMQREQRLEEERTRFLESERGVQAATVAMEELLGMVQARAPALSIRVHQESGGVIVLTRQGRSLSFAWTRRFSNSLRDAGLRVQLWDGILSSGVSSEFRAKNATSTLSLEFNVRAEEHGWTPTEDPSGKFLTTAALVDNGLKALLRAADGQRVRL